jgi:hypothetical protein
MIRRLGFVAVFALTSPLEESEDGPGHECDAQEYPEQFRDTDEEWHHKYQWNRPHLEQRLYPSWRWQ